MKENLCRPGGVISTHLGWPPASRQGRPEEVDWTLGLRRRRRSRRSRRSRERKRGLLPERWDREHRGSWGNPRVQPPRKYAFPKITDWLRDGPLGLREPSPPPGSAWFADDPWKNVDEG
ncbi:unnamed protein product [Pleuronectes platessa]|uniref:Uncharacterized protein n=1 Tax=Pleuronectes platessa TaxID=8262 RepID=A0A9N7YXA9_PLEPL|nr:unnamed protein product [Pleuronectes platessa]